MQLIPLSAIEAQQIALTLNGTSYRLRLLDRAEKGVFLDVYQGQTPLITGILCLDRIRLVRATYVEFPGELMFADQEGFDHPTYTGFNTRFLLYFLEDGDEGVGL